MVQFLADSIFYLIIASVVVSLVTSTTNNTDDKGQEEQARAWHANKVNPNSPNYRDK